jgi:two-component system, NarL family, nitrate/nitrite response regulator NarL
MEGWQMRVLLAAPSGLFAEALASLVGEVVSNPEIVGCQPDDSLSNLPAGPFGLVLIDVDSLSDRAPSAVASCAAALPGTPIVAVAEPRDSASVDRLIHAGATGYLPKNYSNAMMQSVLRLVLEGASYRPAITVDRQHPTEKSKSLEGLGLTPRQAEVLSLIAQGKSNRAIGQQLDITEGVVKLHTNAIFKALEVQSRTEAVLVALRAGAVSPQQFKEAEEGRFQLDWLLPHMQHNRLKAQTVLFRKGDAGKDLYYLQRGSVRLVDLDTELGAGEIFGEISIFSPDHRRTSTAVCTSEVDLFSLNDEQVRRIYSLNPHFALYVVYLIARRLTADRVRPLMN